MQRSRVVQTNHTFYSAQATHHTQTIQSASTMHFTQSSSSMSTASTASHSGQYWTNHNAQNLQNIPTSGNYVQPQFTPRTHSGSVPIFCGPVNRQIRHIFDGPSHGVPQTSNPGTYLPQTTPQNMPQYDAHAQPQQVNANFSDRAPTVRSQNHQNKNQFKQNAGNGEHQAATQGGRTDTSNIPYKVIEIMEDAPNAGPDGKADQAQTSNSQLVKAKGGTSLLMVQLSRQAQLGVQGGPDESLLGQLVDQSGQIESLNARVANQDNQIQSLNARLSDHISGIESSNAKPTGHVQPVQLEHNKPFTSQHTTVASTLSRKENWLRRIAPPPEFESSPITERLLESSPSPETSTGNPASSLLVPAFPVDSKPKRKRSLEESATDENPAVKRSAYLASIQVCLTIGISLSEAK
jgi:hypothetical protein